MVLISSLGFYIDFFEEVKLPLEQLGRLLVLLFVLAPLNCLKAQLQPDTAFEFQIHQGAYLTGTGPVVCIDDAHNNLHGIDGGFYPFAKLLMQDGYSVVPNSRLFLGDDLCPCEIMVICNPLHESNLGHWVSPNPSAFTTAEIENLQRWVEKGGSLFIIADHMPYAGAVSELASAFGFSFINGFAKTSEGFWPPSQFTRANERLETSKITEGMLKWERVDSVATFAGSAFTVPDNATGILKFADHDHILTTDTAWAFENAVSMPAKGLYQGAIMDFGKGKIAVFGEAAMFTAQLGKDNEKAGFNSYHAKENAQFALNLVHWLDGVESYTGKVNSTYAKKEILNINRSMEAAFASNNLMKVAACYSDSAVMVGNRHEVNGRAEIDQYWANLKDRAVKWELENIGIEVLNEVAIQRGISRMVFIYEDKEHISEVRFTLIWKRINGHWKIDVDHYSLL